MAPTEQISVEVVDGFVKLEGVVHSPRQKAHAAGIVWELSGVADCMNLIEIVEPPHALYRIAG